MMCVCVSGALYALPCVSGSPKAKEANSKSADSVLDSAERAGK